MRPPSSSIFKREFLKKWMLGLQFYANSSTTNTMSFLERKNIIDLSGDVAMASARDGKTSWSRALLASSLKQTNDENNMNKGLIKNILGNDFERLITKASSFGSLSCNIDVNNKRVRSKKILRRSSCAMRRASRKEGSRSSSSSVNIARSIAKRMVKKRTQMLKGLVPGGEAMVDESSLLEETMDYVVALQARVVVMRQLLAKASERIVSSSASGHQSN